MFTIVFLLFLSLPVLGALVSICHPAWLLVASICIAILGAYLAVVSFSNGLNAAMSDGQSGASAAAPDMIYFGCSLLVDAAALFIAGIVKTIVLYE
jgi:hypothetical protein